jgi:glyoxylase-like metal-dependent hydrolase (beta-lactamase superfamily II)
VEVRCFTVGMFQVNAYLVRDPKTGASAVVDTGESDELLVRLQALDPAPDIRCILLTHAHVDHAGALGLLQEALDVPAMCGTAERPLLEGLADQGRWFGLPRLEQPPGRIERWLEDGDTIEIGETTLHFLATPGHSPGQGCFHDDADILVGDTLFAGSIGRVDLPGSDPAAMKRSLERLFELPLDMRVHCGHGPETTLERELRDNPFLGFLRRGR